VTLSDGGKTVRWQLCFSTRSTGSFSFLLLQSVRLLTKLYLPHQTLCPLPRYTNSSVFMLRSHSLGFLPLYVTNMGRSEDGELWIRLVRPVIFSRLVLHCATVSPALWLSGLYCSLERRYNLH
jgi:hypothetical protein